MHTVSLVLGSAALRIFEGTSAAAVFMQRAAYNCGWHRGGDRDLCKLESSVVAATIRNKATMPIASICNKGAGLFNKAGLTFATQTSAHPAL